MKNLVIHMIEKGGPEVLQFERREMPLYTENQILIQVHAFGLNRPDIFQRKGNYPAPSGAPSDILGLEVSGEVIAVGDQVTQWKVGDQVCALIPGGGYAQFCVAHPDHCLPVKRELSLIDAAGLPETLFTVWLNVFKQLETNSNVNKRLLIHGGSGGIGTQALQLAKHFNYEAYTTAGSLERAKKCEEIGAIQAINYRDEDFEEAFSHLEFDLILDSIGGDYVEKNLNLLKEEGKLIFINAMKNRRGQIDILKIMQKRLHITGSTLRPRSDEFKAELRDSIRDNVWVAYLNGKIKPIVQDVMPASDIIQAHQRLEKGEVFGKLIMKW